MSVATEFFAAAIRSATPLALAAYGELVIERAGIINIGLEGAIISGALAATIATATGPEGGLLAATAAGGAVALLFALFVVYLRADQIIAGMATTLLGLGATGTIYRVVYGAAGISLTVPTFPTVPIPILTHLPIIGAALFDQPLITYLAYLLAPLLWWWLYRTHSGLGLRAIGERLEAARSAGINVSRTRLIAAVFGGALGGLSGGTLVLAQAGTFAEGMSAGRGFIAIAIVALGRWHPAGVAIAALLFGAATAFQFLFQASGSHAPYQVFLALPYILTLLALATTRSRRSAPSALGLPEPTDD